MLGRLCCACVLHAGGRYLGKRRGYCRVRWSPLAIIECGSAELCNRHLDSCKPFVNSECLLPLLTACLQDLGLSGIYADGVTAAALNQGAFDAAIAAVNRKAAERYKAAGWQLAFGEDEPTPDVNAEKFIRQGAMKFTAVPAAGSDGGGTADGAVQQQKRQLGVVTVTSPVLTSKSISETVQQAGQGPQAEAMIAATKVRVGRVKYWNKQHSIQVCNTYNKRPKHCILRQLSLCSNSWMCAFGSVSTAALLAFVLKSLPFDPGTAVLQLLLRHHMLHPALLLLLAQYCYACLQDKYMHRFLGNWYTKVFSVAQAMEWIMLDSLRNKNTWS